jgi:hypothetical protein
MRRVEYSQKEFWLAYIPLIVAPILLLSPVLFTGKALFWGTPSTQFTPWWKWAFDTLISGHLPLWNPLVGMGAPLIANYQSALFYPPNWIYFCFYLLGSLPALAWAQALILVLHLIWAGFGMAFLVKHLGLGILAQIVSGLAYSLSGYLVARAWFSSLNAAVAWIPWILLLTYNLCSSPKKVKVGLTLGVIIGFQLLAGHAQTSWYTLIFSVLWVGYWSWRQPRDSFNKDRFRILGIFEDLAYLGFSILVGLAISAIQLLPTLEYLLQSQRAAAAEYESAMTYSFWPWRFLGLVVPNLFGNPAHSDYWGYANFWEDAIYVGIAPLLLAISALFHLKPKVYRREVVTHKHPFSDSTILPFPFFLLILILISVLLAMGKNTPVFPWLYYNFPTFDMFRAPTRFSIWLVVALAILAGIGAESWRRPTGRGLYWTRLGTAGAFAVSIGAGLGWYLLRDMPVEMKPTFVPAIAMAGLWGLGTGILALTAPEDQDCDDLSKGIWRLAVMLWISIDLLVAGWGLNPGIGLDFYRQEPVNLERVRQEIGKGRLYLLVNDEDYLKFERFFRFESFTPIMGWDNLRPSMLPNLNMLEGIPVVNNYDPIVPGRYARWMDAIKEINISLREDLLDRMAVSLLEWSVEIGDFGVRFVPRDSAPRLRWVPCSIFVEDSESAWVSSQSTGWLVLSDVWYPGWQAWVDGEIATLERADYLFRAVEVPAGSHQVEFIYRPYSFYIGAVISLITILGLVGYFWIVKAQQRSLK